LAGKEILVAVDASERSKSLVEYAAKMALDMDSKLHILYVSHVAPIPAEYQAYAKEENVDAVAYNEGLGMAVLARLEGLAKAYGVKTETDLEHGNPASSIVEYASGGNVLLVVVGLRGLHGLSRVRSLGSVARRVVESSPVPVVVVPT
jgi:nucleotide-binding universal stress UspA family protein